MIYLLELEEYPTFFRRMCVGCVALQGARRKQVVGGLVKNNAEEAFMEDSLSRAEHVEFAKRMEADHERFNSRLKKLEDTSRDNTKLLITIEKLATNMENMQTEVKKQGERLVKLEAQDGEMWRKVIGYIVTTVIGLVIGYIFTRIGM